MTLDQKSLSVLRVIRESGIVAGRDVKARAAVSYTDLVAACQSLVQMGLIDAKGDTNDPQRIARTIFRFRPSEEQRISRVLKQS